MDSDSISPRAAVVVGALALLPIAWYGFANSGAAGVAISSSIAGLVSAINVAIIVAALLIATGPVASSGHHESASA